MKYIPPFSSDRMFYGKEYFAYGLDRSGEFTIRQAELLVAHGWAYLALAQGDREPANQEELRFFHVFSGHRKPVSEHEKAWSVYLSKTSKKAGISSY